MISREISGFSAFVRWLPAIGGHGIKEGSLLSIPNLFRTNHTPGSEIVGKELTNDSDPNGRLGQHRVGKRLLGPRCQSKANLSRGRISELSDFSL
jgi:hypothetical protein